MEEKPLPHQKIVYVCCNRREPGERVCCASHGGVELRDALKARVKDLGYRTKIRVSQSGCMDRCEEGANVQVFPDNVWLTGVTLDDVEPLVDRLIANLEKNQED